MKAAFLVLILLLVAQITSPAWATASGYWRGSEPRITYKACQSFLGYGAGCVARISKLQKAFSPESKS
jgi:hypothetical protein